VDDIRLNPTSFIVLGLLERLGEATPYELKQHVAAGVGNFWTVQHSQLYSEPERLARGGYVEEEREESGRRRRTYRITERGRGAMGAWRADVHSEPTELRDLGLLKLFFGADPAEVAAIEVASHRAKLEEYEAMHTAAPEDVPRGAMLSLECGIGHEREWVRYWEAVASERPARGSRSGRGDRAA
jgi:PadR family transcriptional regulator, regulatory protein AphA